MENTAVEEKKLDQVESNSESEEKGKVFTQEEVDEIIEKRLAREKKNADKKVKDAVEEAKRYAKMTKDQKTEYENEKLQKELDELRK